MNADFELGAKEDSSPDSNAATKLAAALEDTSLFEVVEVEANVGQINILGRVRGDKESVFMDRVGWPMIDASEKDDIKLFCGKQYLIFKGAKRFAWVIGVASRDIQEAVDDLCTAFAPPAREVVSIPLRGKGPPQSGGQLTGRKGAAPVGARGF